MRKVPVLLSLALAASTLAGGSAAEAKPKPPKPKKYGYVVNTVVVPTNNTQARELGVDLDKDGQVDNQLGMVLGTFAGQGVDVQGATTALVTSGQQVTLFSVRTTSLKNAKGVKIRLFKGLPVASPDLDGGGTFQVDKAALHADLKGKIKKKVLIPKPGNVPFTVPGFLPGMTNVTVDLLKGVVTATCTKKRCTAGKIAGGIPKAQIDSRIIPAIGLAARTVIARDCTGTTEETCAEGSDGRTMMSLLDTNNDGAVPDQEVKENSLIGTILAPDVDLDGNGTVDAMSFAVGFTAAASNVRGD